MFTAKALKGLTKPGRNGLGAEREATAPPPCGSAHHPVTDTSADHREPGTMAFYVVPELSCLSISAYHWRHPAHSPLWLESPAWACRSAT